MWLVLEGKFFRRYLRSTEPLMPQSVAVEYFSKGVNPNLLGKYSELSRPPLECTVLFLMCGHVCRTRVRCREEVHRNERGVPLLRWPLMGTCVPPVAAEAAAGVGRSSMDHEGEE